MDTTLSIGNRQPSRLSVGNNAKTQTQTTPCFPSRPRRQVFVMPKRHKEIRRPTAKQRKMISTLCTRMCKDEKARRDHDRLVRHYDHLKVHRLELAPLAKVRALASAARRVRESIDFLEFCLTMPLSLAKVWPEGDCTTQEGTISYFARNSLVNAHTDPSYLRRLRSCL